MTVDLSRFQGRKRIILTVLRGQTMEIYAYFFGSSFILTYSPNVHSRKIHTYRAHIFINCWSIRQKKFGFVWKILHNLLTWRSVSRTTVSTPYDKEFSIQSCHSFSLTHPVNPIWQHRVVYKGMIR